MAAEHEKRRPADDSEQMVIRRWGQAHWGQAPGPSLITGPCMHAGRQARIPAGGAPEDCQRSIGKRPAPCLLVLYMVADVTLIAHGRRHTPPRPQNGINGTTTVRRTITATNTAVNARSMETDPNRAGFSTRRTGPITGSVMPWVIRRAW